MDDLGRGNIHLRCQRVGPRQRNRVRRVRRSRLLGLGELIDDTTDDLAGGPLDALADLAELDLLDEDADLGADDFEDINDDDALSGLGAMFKDVDSMFIGPEQFSDPVAHELVSLRREVGRLRSLLRKRTNQLNNCKKVSIRAQKRRPGVVRKGKALPAKKKGGR